MNGAVSGAPRALLRLEAFAVFVGALLVFHSTGQSWWLAVVLFFAPDLSMTGYLLGPNWGARIYNFAHWAALPIACCAIGWFANSPLVLAVGCVWISHIGFDRALGFGLKYPTAFGASHLGIIGDRSGSR